MNVCCAADDSTQWKYLSFVIAKKQDIQKINLPPITHMRRWFNRANKKSLAKKVDDTKNLHLFCFKVERTKIIRDVKKLRAVKRGRYSRVGKVYEQFDYVLVSEIKKVVGAVLRKYNISFDDLTIEADKAVEKTLRIGGLNVADEGDAFKIADIVAWNNSNRKRDRMKAVKEIDLSSKIRERVIKKLRLK